MSEQEHPVYHEALFANEEKRLAMEMINSMCKYECQYEFIL